MVGNNEIENLLNDLSEDIDLNGVSFLAHRYADLAAYDPEGPLADRVKATMKRIRDFSERKLETFEAQDLTPEKAEAYSVYLEIANKDQEQESEKKERNDKIFVAITPSLSQYDEEKDCDDIDPETDLDANGEAWDKETADIQPYTEKTKEDGKDVYVVTEDFEELGGFFASLDKKTRQDFVALARLSTIISLHKNAPSEDKEANRKAFIEGLRGQLDKNSTQLWLENQKQLYKEEHPEFSEQFDLAAAEVTDKELENPADAITAATEEEVKDADRRIATGGSLSLMEMAKVAKARQLLNKPARQEMMAVIERAGKADSLEGQDLVAFKFLTNEVERVPEYKKISNSAHIEKGTKHLTAFYNRLAASRGYQRILETKTVEFNKDTFANKKVFKSAAAMVLAVNSAAEMQKAERMSLKTRSKKLWNKVYAWDDKMTKEHKFLYPMARSAMIGATTGAAGLTAYSGWQLYKVVKKSYTAYKEKAEAAKSQGKEYKYKSYFSYIRDKENREEALDVGKNVALAVVSAGFTGFTAFQHGAAAVTGLAGQFTTHGFGVGANALGNVSNLYDKVVSGEAWESVKGAVTNSDNWLKAGKAIVNNARVLTTTTVSLAYGMSKSMITAHKQREAETKMDKMLQEYGVTELPTDRKTKNLRSNNPAAYFEKVLKDKNIELSKDKLTILNDIAKEINGKRKEKKMLRWGTVAGSAIGMTMAGVFGAPHQDLQADTAVDTPTDGSPSDEMGLAAEDKGSASAHLGDGYQNDDMTIGEKLKAGNGTLVAQSDATRVDNLERQVFEPGQESSVQEVSGHGQTHESAQSAATETPTVSDGIDVHNLSAEQKHDLDMLFKRYPRAATLILEGNENPAVTDVPHGSVNTSANLQDLYEKGQIGDEQLKQMVKFAGEHFDARGNFTGPDADALNAETRGASAGHSGNVDYSQGNRSAAETTLSDNEASRGRDTSGSLANDSTSEQGDNSNGQSGDEGQMSDDKSKENVESQEKEGDEQTLTGNDTAETENANQLEIKTGQVVQPETKTVNTTDNGGNGNSDQATVKAQALNDSQTQQPAGNTAVPPTMGENGFMKTASGTEFRIENNGDIVYKNLIMSDAEAAKADAEVYASLQAQIASSKSVTAGQMAFMSEYAQQHNLSMSGSMNLMAENTDQPTRSAQMPLVNEGKGQTENQTLETSVKGEVKTSNTSVAAVRAKISGRTSVPYEDDVYAFSGNKGAAAAAKDLAQSVDDNGRGSGLEDSHQAHSSSQTVNTVGEVHSQHRVLGAYFSGIRGHYTFVDHGAGAPELDTHYLSNVPQRLDIHGHIRATHEWNANGSYESYLGGAIQGPTNVVNAQLENVFRNIEGGDVVYRDMQLRMSRGYQPTEIESRWMQNFTNDCKKIGLGYVDGKLQAIRNPASLVDEWNRGKTASISNSSKQYRGY